MICDKKTTLTTTLSLLKEQQVQRNHKIMYLGLYRIKRNIFRVWIVKPFIMSFIYHTLHKRYKEWFVRYSDLGALDAFFFPSVYASGPNSVATNFLNEALYHLFLIWFSDRDD